MVEFSTFDPDADGRPELPIDIARLGPDDVEPCAQLAAARQDDPVTRWRDTFTTALTDPDQIVLVATHRHDLAGYGKAARLHPEANGGRNVPAGWYLTGVVVAPPHRRRGIARRLTLARLAEIGRLGAPEVWFFAAATNQASIRLHEVLGFREVTRDFEFPGVTFSGGTGVLMRWQPRPPSDPGAAS